MEKPDLSEVPLPDLVGMMMGCAQSDDPTDKEFAKFCREEIAKRKPMPASSSGRDSRG